MNKQENLIVFIPGCKGSALLDKNNRVIWPNFVKAQFDHKTSLAFKLPPHIKRHKKRCHATNLVDSVPLIPKLLNYDVYGSFIDILNKRLPKDTRLQCFSYDWRKDLIEEAQRLLQLIEQHIEKHSGRIDIICHSMGGLIVSYVLKFLPQNVIDRIFFISVPFEGVPRVVNDLEYGCKVGINRSLLCAEAIASFESTYYMLPQNPMTTNHHDLFDISVWEEFKIGRFLKDNTFKELIEGRLEKGKAFHQVLQSLQDYPAANMELYFLRNYDLQTPSHLSFTPKICISEGRGDGTVPKSSLLTPNYFKHFRHHNIDIETKHAESFRSQCLIDLIIDAVA